MNPVRKLAAGSAVILCALLLAPDRVVFAQEDEAKQLVVMLRGKLGNGPVAGAGLIFGTGNNRLYIATANHVVRKGLNEAENLEMQLNWLPGEWVPVKLLDHGDKDLDLAVLVAQGAEDLAIPALHWETLGQPAELEQRDEVFPVGYPSGTPWFVSVQPHLVSEVDSQVLKTEGTLVPGNSGGALFTKDWRIVGIVSSVGALLGESTRIDLVINRLKAWNYPVQLEFGEPLDRPSSDGPQSKCQISGIVFDSTQNEPLSAVQLSLRTGPTPEARRGKTVAKRVATTGPDGSFQLECPVELDGALFPLTVELGHPNWKAQVITAEQVAALEKRVGVNIPVRIRREMLKQPPYESKAAIRPGTIGEILTIQTRGSARSYDFTSKRLGTGPTGGDFYFSGGYPSFFANNSGQMGLRDFGETGRTLNQVPPLLDNLEKYGVNAIVGHVYLAQARAAGTVVIFRILDIGYSNGETDYYKIQYANRATATRDQRERLQRPAATATSSARLSAPPTFCQANNITNCRKHRATCYVLRGVDGSESEVCRWDSKRSASACSSSVGTWLAVNSRFTRLYPDAIPPGASGACISQARNVR